MIDETPHVTPPETLHETLHGALHRVIEEQPDDPAIHFGSITLTYRTLGARIAAATAAVERRTAPGDRVAMVARNGPWWVDAYFAVPGAGRILALVSPRLTVHEMRADLDRIDARLVIVDPEAVGGDPHALARAGREVMTLSSWSEAVNAVAVSRIGPDPLRVGASEPDADRPAWLVFTSGTTAAPKAAVLSHRNLLGAVRATAAARPLPPDDVYLFAFPLWHVAGYNVLCRLIAGRPVVLEPDFDADRIIVDIDRYDATSMSVAATMLNALLDAADREPAHIQRLSGLREIYYGAAPMPEPVLRRAVQRLRVDMWQGYGMTELAGNAVFLGPDDHELILSGRGGWPPPTGRAAPGVEIAIVDDIGSTVVPGEVGEVVVRAEQVMTGYWNDDVATAAAISSDGWLRTGDVGTIDQSGLLRLLDRKKDVIITGGENVSAREVEAVLGDHPGVLAVAVVGVFDERWGENVCAVVVPAAPGLDPHEMQAFARRRLAGFKIPRHVVEVDELPTNVSGKIEKSTLRSWLAEHPARLGPRY